jgi:hypothetical protein
VLGLLLLFEIFWLDGGHGELHFLRVLLRLQYLEQAWVEVHHNICIKKTRLCERELRVGHKQPVGMKRPRQTLD